MIFQFNADNVECPSRLGVSSVPQKLVGVTPIFFICISPAPKFTNDTGGLILFSVSSPIKKKHKVSESSKALYITMILIWVVFVFALAMFLLLKVNR